MFAAKRLTAGLLLLSLTACQSAGPVNKPPKPPFRTALIVNPDPFYVSAESTTKMRQIIGQALAGRGWMVTKDDPGDLESTLMTRGHTAKIHVAYDAKTVTIRYLDSSNLKYWKSPGGVEYIHQNYNGWIRRLVHDMAVWSVRM